MKLQNGFKVWSTNELHQRIHIYVSTRALAFRGLLIFEQYMYFIREYIAAWYKVMCVQCI